MDPSRQIRIVIAPFFFIIILFSGVYFSEAGPAKLVSLLSTLPAVGVVGIVSLAILPTGFLISTITMLLMRALFFLSGSAYHTYLSKSEQMRVRSLILLDRDKELETSTVGWDCRIWEFPAFCIEKNRTKREMVSLAVSFDHGILYNQSKGIHEWLMRTYTGFVSAANSVGAILLACVLIVLLVSHNYMMYPPFAWWLCAFVMVVLLLLGAWRARRDTIQMIRFQVRRQWLRQIESAGREPKPRWRDRA